MKLDGHLVAFSAFNKIKYVMMASDKKEEEKREIEIEQMFYSLRQCSSHTNF